MDRISLVKNIMLEFSEATGLSKSDVYPRRYLWTDAFGVCNFLELFTLTGEQKWMESALLLVDQVHNILGRHREDDPRKGWISGLKDEEGGRHPTIGGLRIGKIRNERKSAEPVKEQEEWDRDGQYYHYLTKWMQALNRVSRTTGDPIFNTWAIELAKTAHGAFVHSLLNGSKRMHWKMSIDLSYPLVTSMGQHDPLDGLVTYKQLQTAAMELSNTGVSSLDAEIADMEHLCRASYWITDDPLGIGGLLADCYKAVLLIAKGSVIRTGLLNELLEASITGLLSCVGCRSFEFPAEYRLAFRELGLSIGLHAVEKIQEEIAAKTDRTPDDHLTATLIKRFAPYRALAEKIEEFWLDPYNRKGPEWKVHADINNVMLATSLAPGSYLEL